ncbi:MAG: DUF1175 family protein [Myxococcales bacterium]
MLLMLLLTAAAAGAPSQTFLRQEVARAALSQVRSLSPDWNEKQRDCAGLVRFVYRSAFLKLDPDRLKAGLWRDGSGKPTAFADAETLLAGSFTWLGRDPATRASLKSGDLVAFRQRTDGDVPVYHLMLVVRPDDPAHGLTRVVYHPGEAGASVRVGTLDALVHEAAGEWRAVPENPSFLGYFRFSEWGTP